MGHPFSCLAGLRHDSSHPIDYDLSTGTPTSRALVTKPVDWDSCFPTSQNRDMGHPFSCVCTMGWLGFVLSHPFDNNTSKGWGTHFRAWPVCGTTQVTPSTTTCRRGPRQAVPLLQSPLIGIRAFPRLRIETWGTHFH